MNVIREALHRYEPLRLAPKKEQDRAAVALVLAGPEEQLRLCFILRARRRGDRWSGQMAFPGGRAEKGDSSPLQVAQREACEEVGLRLETAECLGALSEMRISYRGADTGSILSPFVFYAGENLPQLYPNEEVAAAWWIPLTHLWNPENRDWVPWVHNGRRRLFPGIHYEGQVIWGLTHRVLRLFAAALGEELWAKFGGSPVMRKESSPRQPGRHR